MSRWLAVELANPSPVSAGTGAFNAVGHVTALGSVRQFGNAFPIHPVLIVTAAHVVTYLEAGRMRACGRIDVDFGQARAGVWRLAVPLDYVASLGKAGESDLAVLRLGSALAEPANILSVETLSEGQAADALLWGNPDGTRLSQSIHAVRQGGVLRFPLAASLPGWSGGPLTVPAAAPEGGVALGAHRFWNQPDQNGEAVALDPAALNEAIEAIRQLG